MSRATRTLINVASLIGLAWIGYVVYGSFTSSGTWRVVVDFLSSDYGKAGMGGVFAACVLIGFIPIAAASWLVWRVAFRGRPSEDFPRANIRK